ncbi:hypothetical protein GEMRC1_008715 [Eukaryota sp. GEM-RC1]
MLQSARLLAIAAHTGQYRRGGDPYYKHPERVVDNIITYFPQFSHNDTILASAWLHDVLEDTSTTPTDLSSQTSQDVLNIVLELTNDVPQLKLLGKKLYLMQKMSEMSDNALVIKLADRLDNIQDLDVCDRKWAIKYAQQTKDIMEYLQDKRFKSESTIFQPILQEILEVVNSFLEKQVNE